VLDDVLLIEPYAVLVHHCSSVSLPRASSSLGGGVLCRRVACGPENNRSQGLHKIGKLCIELSSIVAEHMHWNSERNQPRPVEYTEDFIRTLAHNRSNELVTGCLVHTIQEALVLPINVGQGEQIHTN
jgi:hypothetical protein